jgi:protein-disulfide isomerase
MRPPVGWGAVLGGGTIAGIGFTVSLLIATLAFDGQQLEQAKIGVLSAVVLAMVDTTLVALVIERMSEARRARALLGVAQSVVDLTDPVDPERDHVRGPMDAPVTIVEYGDFECPYCGQAESVVRELLSDFGDVRYVWRHLPLTDVHPHAQMAAEAAEAAAMQGQFWTMRDLLFDNQDALGIKDLLRHAESIGLDLDRFRESLKQRKGAARVARDVESADLSGVSGTPTFFVNGRRHHGAYDIDSLSHAVIAARDRALLLDGG